jgi:hypothetical protein
LCREPVQVDSPSGRHKACILTVSPGIAKVSADAMQGDASNNATASVVAALEVPFRAIYGFGRSELRRFRPPERTSCHDSRRPVRACATVVSGFVSTGRLRSTGRGKQRYQKVTRTR